MNSHNHQDDAKQYLSHLKENILEPLKKKVEYQKINVAYVNAVKPRTTQYKNLYEAIDEAQSISEVWYILFYFLSKNPDLRQRNYNSWMSLIDQGSALSIFNSLLEKNILPNKKNLTICDSKTNLNGWTLLASNHAGKHSILKLFEKNIWPTSGDLSVYSYKGVCAWDLLLSKNIPINADIFAQLYIKNIGPGYEIIAKNHLAYNILDSAELNLELFEEYSEEFLNGKRVSYTSHSYERVGQRIRQIQNFDLLHGIKIKNNNASLLLSHTENQLNFYSFLYLFYSLASENKKTDIYNLLPAEIWIRILHYYILPHPMPFTEDHLSSKETQFIFLKYHLHNSMDSYLNGFSFFKRHKERVVSLKEAIHKKENLNDLSQLLATQFKMFQNPWYTAYVNPNKKYQTSFSRNLFTDEQFESILNDGYAFSKNMEFKR